MIFVSTNELNGRAQTPGKMITESEKAYSEKLRVIADEIIEVCAEKPIILLSGPSGSGKTTSAKLLEAFLDAAGFEAHTISMDNYFYRREDGVVPLDEHGKPDLESPDCLDIPLLHSQMNDMFACRAVNIPTFDFVNQRRAKRVIPLRRKPREIVIFEGIHALNPRILNDSHATGVYVSVRTRVTCGDIVLHPSKIRLLRRLIRDRQHRGQSFADTVARLGSVSRGERLFIDPYKANADFSVDTFCPYELSVYRDLLLPELSKIDPALLAASGADQAISVLRALSPIPKSLVPENALIQEFLGR